MINYFEFSCPVKILSGDKALVNLSYEMEQLGAKKAMLITDQGVVGAGLMKFVDEAMDGAKVKITAVYDKTPPDSSNKVINEIAKIYRKNKCDSLIALGGGSCMDTAKGVNIVISENTDDLMKFQGTDRLTSTMRPFIAIPTTAGTGSEVTMAAVIRNVEAEVKMPFVSERLYPDVAILDPKMTLTMPPKITAATGMDALTHAVEAYYGLQKNPVSDAYAVAAVDLIFANLIKAVKNGKDIQARMNMANGSLLAGIAFSNSMVGIVHALAHATGGVCHVPHGVANAILLPWGMEYNLKKAAAFIGGLALYMGIKDIPTGKLQKGQAAVEAVHKLNEKLNKLSGMPTTLSGAGVPEDKLPQIAKTALNDGSCTYNPEDVTYKAAMNILKKAY